MSRRWWWAFGAALCSLVLAACTSATAPSGTAAHAANALSSGRGSQAPVARVPWARVGPGWLLALWGENAGRGAGPPPSGEVPQDREPTSVYLVSPSGQRYLVTTLPPPACWILASWSGDGQRALLTRCSSSPQRTTLVELDLRAGTTRQFSIAGSATVAYSRPHGLAILASLAILDSNAYTLERLDLSGNQELTYPSSFPGVGGFTGYWLSSPDGTQLVLGAAQGLALVANDGTVVATLPVPAITQGCSPVRWWSPGEVLATCHESAPSRLFVVPISGAAPTALTASIDGQGQDQGDEDAWAVGTATFVQDAGACGYQYLAQLQPDGTTAPVTVPDVDRADSTLVVGADGGRLALQATVSCGSGVSLLWYDAAANTTQVVLGPPINGGGVIGALLYPDGTSPAG